MIIDRGYLQKTRSLLKRRYLTARRLLLFPLLVFRRTYRPAGDEIKKILLLRYDRIGDMVLSTPVFRILKIKYPDARITVVCSRVNADVIRNDPYVADIFIYKGPMHFLKEIRKERYDLVIDLFYTYELKNAFLALLSGARYRLGFAIAGRRLFFNIKIPSSTLNGTMTERLIALVGGAELPVNDIRPQIYLLKEEKKWAQDYIASRHVGQDGLKVAIHPGGFYHTQRWPAERFAKVAKVISTEFQARILLLGHGDEKELLERIRREANLSPEPIIAYGLPLRKTISLLSLCDIFIGNNSGILHIACALNIPTVSMMGPGDPDLWAPVGAGHIVINKNLPCSPCGRGECSSHSCMNEISADDVINAVRSKMKEIRG